MSSTFETVINHFSAGDQKMTSELVRQEAGKEAEKALEIMPEKKQSQEKKQIQERYNIFYSTADTERWGAVSGTGDVDYARSLAEGLNQVTPGAACFIQHLDNEKDVYHFIDAHKQGNTPILHILRNAPRIGSAFTVEGMSGFKKKGGKIVVTAVEFNKHRFAAGGSQFMKELLDCIRAGDEAVFLDELDKRAALHCLPSLAANDLELKAKIERAKVICVPPTVTVNLPPVFKRGQDIISFGMIRTGKGLAHLRKLAGLMKQSTHPLMKDKKILIVGTVMLEPIQGLPGTTRSNFAQNRELFRLMSCIYPTKRQEMREAINGNEADNKTLKDLLKRYQLEEKQGLLKSALPIELHIDVPEHELSLLFMRARYSYLPPYRGATLRNTSISCSLAQSETGLVTLSHQGNITPPELQKDGCFAKALVLFQDEEYGTGDDDKMIYENDGYAGAVFQEILNREIDPKLNEETLLIGRKLLQERLSRTVVTRDHRNIYENLIKASKLLDSEAGVSSLIFAPGFELTKIKPAKEGAGNDNTSLAAGPAKALDESQRKDAAKPADCSA